MSVIDSTIKANAAFAGRYDSKMGRPPAPKLVIVICMDPRVTNIGRILGLSPGDADIIRKAGSVINEDSIRSLVVSTRVLGAKEIMIVKDTSLHLLALARQLEASHPAEREPDHGAGGRRGPRWGRPCRSWYVVVQFRIGAAAPPRRRVPVRGSSGRPGVCE